jgi:hypothetical protein
VSFQFPANGRSAPEKIRSKRVEVVDVEGESNAPVTEICEDVDRILQTVVGETVGVVAEEHGD